MNRRYFIERTLRQIYGGMPTDDSSITINLVNAWLNDATAIAAKQNYKDNVALDGVGFVNNSFYTRFTGLSISADYGLVYKLTLPQIPLGIGANEGISTLELYDPSTRQVSKPFVPLTEAQKSIYQNVRPIPNRVLYWYEGNILFATSTLMLNLYTANVTMVSAGDFNNLDSELIVPSDYFPVIVEYIKQQLMFERNVPIDVSNDGNDLLNKSA